MGEKSADLDPCQEGSDIWGTIGVDRYAKDREALANISKEGVELDFIEIEDVISGHLLAKVQAPDGQQYRLFLGLQIHNYGLRSELLKKLGYKTLPYKILKYFSLNFPTDRRARIFVNTDIDNALSSNPEKWVKNITEEKGKQKAWTVSSQTLSMQDGLLLPISTHQLDLARGVLGSENDNDRALNSVLIPWALVDIPENINFFAWDIGQDEKDDFWNPYFTTNSVAKQAMKTTYYDAIWIIRKIAKLTLKDWADVARAGEFSDCDCIEDLVLAKIVNRRNDLLRRYKARGIKLGSKKPESGGFELKKKLSCRSEGKKIVNNKGVLLPQGYRCEGYAQDFTSPKDQPESPLSMSNIFTFIKHIGIEQAINGAVIEFNNRLPSKDTTAKKYQDAYVDALFDQFVDLFENGESGAINKQFVPSEFAGGSLILLRQVIFGSYLGSNNDIQMADTIGFSVKAGKRWTGLGFKPETFIGAQGDISFTRRYMHLRPLRSAKQADEEDFKNLLIPYFKLKIGENLEKAINAFHSSSGQNISEDELQELLGAIEEFNQYLGVGESIIITDDIGLGFQGSFRKILNPTFAVRANFGAQNQTVFRLHLYKASDNILQVYNDKGNVISFNVGLGLDAHLVDIVSTRIQWTPDGRARSDFYLLNHSNNFEEWNEMTRDEIKETGDLKNLLAMAKVLSTGSLSGIPNKPITSKYHFTTSSVGLDLLFLVSKSLDTHKFLTLKLPEADYPAHFVRSTDGHRVGLNFQGVADDIVNSLIDHYLENSDFIFQSDRGGDPGNSIFGTSKLKLTTVEARYFDEEEDGKTYIDEYYLNQTYRWRGFYGSRDDIEYYFGLIQENFGEGFVPDEYTGCAGGEYQCEPFSALLLYTIDVSITPNEKGLQHFMGLGVHQLAKIARDYRGRERPQLNYEGNETAKVKDIRQFAGQATQNMATFLEGDKKGYAKHVVDEFKHAFSDLEKALSMGSESNDMLGRKELDLLFGPDGYHIRGTVLGFREGDVNAESKSRLVFGQSGDISDDKALSPWGHLLKRTGMHKGELFLEWLMPTL